MVAAVPKVTSIVHHPPSSNSPPKIHPQQPPPHSFVFPPPPAPISTPAPSSPASPALPPPASSSPAASFAHFLLKKVTQNGDQQRPVQNMKLEKTPPSVAPPSPRPSSCSSLSSTNTLEEKTWPETKSTPSNVSKGNILEDTMCAAGPVNMTKLDALQLDLADYEKLLRAKMHKNLRCVSCLEFIIFIAQ